MPQIDSIRIRRDTAANWASVNPVLDLGELGLETDTGFMKAGDGATAWASLGYVLKGSTYAPLASPTFTGTPAAPTPGTNINTTQIPTTAWVNSYYAPLASPTFTGTPAAPTPGTNINTTQIPTTAWVNSYYAPKVAPTFTGLVTMGHSWLDDLPIAPSSTFNMHFEVRASNSSPLYRVFTGYGSSYNRFFDPGDSNHRLDIGIGTDGSPPGLGTIVAINSYNDTAGAGLPIRFAGKSIHFCTAASGDPQGSYRISISSAGVVNISGVPNYASNAAAITAGLGVGDLYRQGDFVCVVH